MNEKITLIREEKSRNADGYLVRAGECRREIFAEWRSPTRAEFYGAMQAGMETTAVFRIYQTEYHGEKLLEHRGRRYRVVRVYRRTDDFLELSVTDVGEDANGENVI